MAILGNFEITVLTPTIAVSKVTGLVERQWQPLTEYPAPRNDETSATNCQKYVGLPKPQLLPQPEEPVQMQYCQYTNSYINGTTSVTIDHLASPAPREELLEFAIDYKVHCGFSFVDAGEADLIIFRTYLDGERIGSGLVKRERWERSGSYRVRKQGKRVWEGNVWDGQWVQRKWMFEPGRHGTITIEAWRETENDRPTSRGGPFDVPGSSNAFSGYNVCDNRRVMIDLTDPGDELSPTENVMKIPRVKRTKKVDMWPMATFTFDYRTEDTLRTLGIIQKDVVEDEDLETRAPQRDMSAPTVIDLDRENTPLQPSTEEQQRLMQDYGSCHFWNSLDRTTVEEVPVAQSDADFTQILDHMEAEYEQFTSTQVNSESMISHRSGTRTVPEDSAYEPGPEVTMSEQEGRMNLGWILNQNSSTEHELPRNNGVEVVDLTMLD